jgi:sulfate/thiosulfate transport system permease protein
MISVAARRRRVLPGFGLSLGLTLTYLGAVVALPLAALFARSAALSLGGLWAVASEPRVVAALKLSFATAFIAASINALVGTLLAWVLVRYRFPGRRAVDALIDLPFALPTAVAGITLTTLYAETGWFGAPLAALGVKVAFTPLGIVAALVFVGLPFVVRTVQPVLEDAGADVEEAAASLGATRWQTFTRILLPTMTPAIVTGFALAFARGIGEYGSVIFISGNMPLETEIAPLLIMSRLEQFDYPGAAAIAAIMLAVSFALLLGINGLQWWARRRSDRAAS